MRPLSSASLVASPSFKKSFQVYTLAREESLTPSGSLNFSSRYMTIAFNLGRLFRMERILSNCF